MAAEVAQNPPAKGKLSAILVEFDSPGALITAAEKVRDAGYRKWDTHSPFPVHGIDEAMGVRPTRLPWIVFMLGVIGCMGGIVLVWWTNATAATNWPTVPVHFQGYNFHISGKPEFSFVANIPVIFETTVLLASLAAVFGMLALNNLPLHYNPLEKSERFRRATADRFFVCINATDAGFDAAQTEAFCNSLGGLGIERIEEDADPGRLPQWIIIAIWIVVTLALLPPLFVAKARLAKSTEPRIHIIQDMDNQERYTAQQAAPMLFRDGRASRPQVSGTIARGDLREDAHFYRGKVADDWATTYPEQVDVTLPFVQRGQERFNVYCAPCHGLGGAGNGIVSQRAFELDTAGWVQPTDLTTDTILGRAHGDLYNTITNGIRTMAPYGDQISVEDRWAIVSYIRALQRSQRGTIDDVPADMRNELR